MKAPVIGLLVCSALTLLREAPMRGQAAVLTPGTRVLLDAHNAYPDADRFSDRIERALSTGLPVAIEQDLVWHRDPQSGAGRSLVSHGPPIAGTEPAFGDYFLTRIRPLLDVAAREDRRDVWPIITLNLDFKTNEPEHHAAVWELLGGYEQWLTTAERRSRVDDISPLSVGPLLVLTGEADEQERSFHDRVPVGGRLRLFGAVHSQRPPVPAAQASAPTATPADVSPQPRTNYRRWWNLPWATVEAGGQNKAGGWTPVDASRLADLVRSAHAEGLWIRFYTLNGHDPADRSGGWSAGYNFGSLEAAEERWQAAIRAGVDFIAVDQYEAFARVLHTGRN
jgi:hypothetical protein